MFLLYQAYQHIYCTDLWCQTSAAMRPLISHYSMEEEKIMHNGVVYKGQTISIIKSVYAGLVHRTGFVTEGDRNLCSNK